MEGSLSNESNLFFEDLQWPFEYSLRFSYNRSHEFIQYLEEVPVWNRV